MILPLAEASALRMRRATPATFHLRRAGWQVSPDRDLRIGFGPEATGDDRLVAAIRMVDEAELRRISA